MVRCSDIVKNVTTECPPNICKIINDKCTGLSKYTPDEETQLIKLELKKKEIHIKLKELILNFINELQPKDKNKYLCFNTILKALKDTKNNNIVELKNIYGEKYITDTQLRMAYKGLEYDNKIAKCPKNSPDNIEEKTVILEPVIPKSQQPVKNPKLVIPMVSEPEEPRKNIVPVSNDTNTEVRDKPNLYFNIYEQNIQQKKQNQLIPISEPIITVIDEIKEPPKSPEPIITVIEKPKEPPKSPKPIIPVISKPSIIKENSDSINSIIRKTAIKMFVKERLSKELSAINNRLTSKCSKCNTIIQQEWVVNKCKEICIPLEDSCYIHRRIFETRNELLNILQNITMVHLNNIFKNSIEKEEFLKKLFHQKLIENNSLIDSMIDMNKKLENFINKVDILWINYNRKLKELQSLDNIHIINNTRIKYNYDDTTFEFYFKPRKETFSNLIDLKNSISNISNEQLYCMREKWFNCTSRQNKCDWTGETDDTYKCQPK